MKRSIACILIFCLALSMSACSGGKSGSKLKGPLIDLEKEKYDPMTTDPDYLFPNVEVNGDTVKFLCHYPVKKEAENETVYTLLDQYYDLTIENITVPHSDLTQKLIAMVMAGDSPDVTNAYGLELIYQGLIEPWETVFDWTKSPLWKPMAAEQKMAQWNGQTYNLLTYVPKHNYVYFNKKLFTEAGLESPFEAYNRGEWDWNKMVEYGKELTQDANGDGTTDVYGVLIAESMDMLYTTGKGLFSWDSGKVLHNFASPELERYFNFYQDIYTKSKIAAPDGDWNALFTQGKVAMVVGHLWYMSSYKDMFLNGTAGILPDPKDPGADKAYTMIEYEGFSLAKGAKNPGGAVALLAAFRYPTYSPVDVFDIEGRYKSYKIDYKFDDMQWKIFLDHFRTYGSVPVISGVGGFDGEARDRLKEGQPWSTVRETLLPKVEAGIDELMEGLEAMDKIEAGTAAKDTKK